MSATATVDMRELWTEYKSSPSLTIREQIVKHYLPIVRFNAERIRAKLPSEVDVDDLVSAGVFGLMDAIESFDLERGVKFETYCSPRIRGAILDELRQLDWVPRLVRNRVSKIEQATKVLQCELGRVPSDTELARHIGVNAAEFTRMARDSNATGIMSLTRRMNESAAGEANDGDFLRDPNGVDPVTEAEKRDLQTVLSNLLNRTEKLVLVMYYYEGMTMKEIGSTLDLSESRVSQMHTAIINRLRAQLKKRTPVTAK